MKKILFIFCLLLISRTAHAAGNSCILHEGINCNVEPGIPGNVVCNDGWVLSDPTFNFVNECVNVERRLDSKISKIHTTVSLIPNKLSVQAGRANFRKVIASSFVGAWHWLVQVF
jgi:hypothetical protein